MSVGKICDNGMKVVFDDVSATVIDRKDDSVLCVFEQKPGGLYTCNFGLRLPRQVLPGRDEHGESGSGPSSYKTIG